ncbi:MAG TPA: Hsp20/alpha crystallin family protein [Kofleriaceae bacterium]|jgi:HSP20 family protein|nr:Hsp20/alpha crystallin family protein [Kofleriaceae bacterium]
MADIVKREAQGQPERRTIARDPFQLMNQLMGWDPFQELAPGWGVAARPWMPQFEVRETKDSYVFKADVPGARSEDIEISLVGNRLQVSGKRQEEEDTRDDTYFVCERDLGSFTRAFTLPDTADLEHISSDLRDGVLTVVIPKKAEAQPRKIAIGSGEKH